VSSKSSIEAAVEEAEGEEPEEGLAAVAALRTRVDALEALHVEKAIRAGWSWRRVAEALGVTKQAAHKKHARRVAERLAPESAQARKRLVVTGRARQSVRYAREEAAEFRETALQPEHLLLGLLRDPDGKAAAVLTRARVTLEDARQLATELREAAGRPERAADVSGRERLPVAPETRTLLEESLREAVRNGDAHLGEEHLLLAILHDQGGAVARLLDALGVERGELERQLGAAH
jgi:hypothetical protein